MYSGHLCLGHKLCAEYHDPSSKGYPDILFTMSLWLKCPSLKKGHNSVKYSQNYKNNQVISIMYSNSMYDIRILAQNKSSDILLTRLLYYTRCQSRKRDIIQVLQICVDKFHMLVMQKSKKGHNSVIYRNEIIYSC